MTDRELLYEFHPHLRSMICVLFNDDGRLVGWGAVPRDPEPRPFELLCAALVDLAEMEGLV